MASRWDSIASMRRFARGLTIAAVALFALGAATWVVAVYISISALVLGTAAVLCALFAWFRLDHLRELDRLDR